jgi:2-polyprenyl-6-methoxyphenol hydroxylase-like FAD-dependent oxidoreductase
LAGFLANVNHTQEERMSFDGDVLIAGGGPTGMSAALALADLGRRVHVVDKHASGLDFSRAILVNASTLAGLARFGVAAAIAARGRAVEALAFRGPSGLLASGRLEKPVGPGPVFLPQLETEDCLREALAARGVTVERPCEITGFTQDEEGVTATLETNGVRRTFRARYLLGADGHHSRVREGLGVASRVLGPDISMYSADVVMTPPFEEDGCIFLLPEGAGMALRFRDRRVRLAGTNRAVFAALGFGRLIEATTWEIDFAAQFAVADRFGAGRVWLAGDAAHVHSPVGGRGMNMGIADGLRFARAVHDGDFLGYARERREIALAWVKMNERMTRAISRPGLSGRLLRLGARGALKAGSLVLGERLAQTMFHCIAAG